MHTRKRIFEIFTDDEANSGALVTRLGQSLMCVCNERLRLSREYKVGLHIASYLSLAETMAEKRLLKVS